MDNSLSFEIDNAVAILTIDDAPYNRMSLDFMDALEDKVAHYFDMRLLPICFVRCNNRG